jgi:hypothetical protein
MWQSRRNHFRHSPGLPSSAGSAGGPGSGCRVGHASSTMPAGPHWAASRTFFRRRSTPNNSWGRADLSDGSKRQASNILLCDFSVVVVQLRPQGVPEETSAG